MSTKERKDRLIQYIRNLSDPAQLEKIERIIAASDDWADELTEGEKEGIKQAQDQIRNGQTHTSDQVWKKFNATIR